MFVYMSTFVLYYWKKIVHQNGAPLKSVEEFHELSNDAGTLGWVSYILKILSIVFSCSLASGCHSELLFKIRTMFWSVGRFTHMYDNEQFLITRIFVYFSFHVQLNLQITESSFDEHKDSPNLIWDWYYLFTFIYFAIVTLFSL